MKNITFIPMLSLQLFADGGAAGAGTGDGGTAQGSGVTAADAGQQKTGVEAGTVQTEPEAADAGQEQTDPAAAFDALIKGQYKEPFNAVVRKILDGRLSNLREQLKGYEAGRPVFDILAQKYGLDPADFAAIAKAAEEDRSFFEREAMESGDDVENVWNLRKVQRENTVFRRQEQQRQQAEQEQRRQQAAQAQEAEWNRQAEEARKTYPKLSLVAELKNPEFSSLLCSGVPVKAAFEVIHMNEIMSGAMQYAAQRTAKNVTDTVIAGAARPTENGMSSQGAALVKSDVSKMSKQDRADIIRRVQRGEKIRF